MAKFGFGSALMRLFGMGTDTDGFYDDLADLLVENDVGSKISTQFVEQLRDTCKKNNIKGRADIIEVLKKSIGECLPENGFAEGDLPQFILVLGVNGVGKTTSIAKLAHFIGESHKGKKIVLAAGDTFRAAAIEQLKHHGEKLGIEVLAMQSGSDPGAVIHDAVTHVIARKADIAIADTAGRLHNKSNLVRELEKITKIISARIPAERFLTLLAIDATTGQNGFVQAKTFHEAVGIDGIILTKYDSTAKGGIVVTIGKELGIPVYFVGTGESYDAFSPFDKKSFLDDFMGIPDA